MSVPAREPQARLFFALWPALEQAAALYGKANEIAAVAGGRVMRQETLHLTLAFLGDVAVSNLPAVCAVADAVQKLHTGRPAPTFDRLGWWQHNRVVWAGCSAADGAMTRLAAELAQGLEKAGIAFEQRTFVPHVTLMRKVGEMRAFPSMQAQRWDCREFVLVRSRLSDKGAAYERVAAWPLN